MICLPFRLRWRTGGRGRGRATPSGCRTRACLDWRCAARRAAGSSSASRRSPNRWTWIESRKSNKWARHFETRLHTANAAGQLKWRATRNQRKSQRPSHAHIASLHYVSSGLSFAAAHRGLLACVTWPSSGPCLIWIARQSNGPDVAFLLPCAMHPVKEFSSSSLLFRFFFFF